MLHTKFRCKWSSGSGDFRRVFTIYGCGGHAANKLWFSPYPRRFHIKFGFEWASGFEEEDVWNCGIRRRTDAGWTPENGYTMSSPMSLGELKTYFDSKNTQNRFS